MVRNGFVQESAELLEQERVSARYFRLRLRSRRVARLARPGQFVMLSCRPEGEAAWDPLLPRPLAVLDAASRSGEIQLLYYVAGRGTELLRRAADERAPHTRFTILGPQGRGFEAVEGVEAHVGIGGGSGLAPLAFFFRRLRGGRAERRLIVGARRREDLPPRAVFAARGVRIHWATEDGDAGFRGTAAALLDRLLARELRGRRAALYASGPEPMLRAVAATARRLGLPCRVSLEARMACGVGVCRGCVVAARTPHPLHRLCWRTVCQDGPVFDPCELTGWDETE
jgi:dihydroorotate dehydrogenase electron transfer subunit